MRRILSVVLTAAMLLTMFAVGTFSTVVMAAADGSVASGYTPEGTAVGTAAEFAAMTAEGKYYLSADIEITESYAGTFKGTLDGNGKTVTVSNPMFVALEGATIQNLKLKGAVDFKAKTDAQHHTGAIVEDATNSTFKNIYSEATVVGMESGYAGLNELNVMEYVRCAAGGFAGAVWGSATFEDCTMNATQVSGVTAGGLVGASWQIEKPADAAEDWVAPNQVFVFKNCVNNAKITDAGHSQLTDETGATKVTGFSGGLAGYFSVALSTTFTFEGCQNTGSIEVQNTKSQRTGGLVGYINSPEATDETYPVLTAKDCTNSGSVAGGDQVGGLFGWARVTASSVVNCHNTGDINSNGNYAGGLFGRIGLDKTNGSAVNDFLFENCSNAGAVSAQRQYTGGLVGYTRMGGVFQSCSNTGEILGCTQLDNLFVVKSGGILAKSNDVVCFYNCVNNAPINGSSCSGGIAGSVGSSGCTGADEFIGCYNYGDVNVVIPELCYADQGKYESNTPYVPAHSNASAAGLLGYAYGSGASQYPLVKYCGVIGNVRHNAGVASGIVGYFNTSSAVAEAVYVLGEITSGKTGATSWVPAPKDSPAEGVDSKNAYGIWWNNNSESMGMFGVFFLEGKAPEMAFMQKGVESTLESVASLYNLQIVTMADVSSGKLCVELNKCPIDPTEIPFYQNLTGDNKDMYPTTDSTHGYVGVDANGNYVNMEKPVITDAPTTDAPTTDAPTTGGDVVTEAPTTGGDVVTEAPTTGNNDKATEAPTTTPVADDGCQSVLGASALLVLALAVAAPAVILKKKED